MKKSILITAAAVCMAAAAVSCSKSDVPSEHSTDLKAAEISVQVSSDAFRSKAVLSEDNEKKINNVQIFVFREDGALDAYASSDSGSGIKLSCTTGQRTVKAVVNAPDLSLISRMSDLNSSVSKLSDNTLTNFVMTGSKEVSVNADQTVQLTVSRLAARLAVEKVSVAFTSQAYRNMEMKVTGIYAINVAGDASYDLSAAPAVWYNKKAYATSEADALLHDAADAVLVENTPYEANSVFYVYPNPTADDSQADEFSARHTRIVVETSLGGTTYYYPITVGGIERNKKYTIRNLTITRPGSIDPDVPVTSGECSFTITVSDWEEGFEKEWTI